MGFPARLAVAQKADEPVARRVVSGSFGSALPGRLAAEVAA